jgi:hypothetical protein
MPKSRAVGTKSRTQGRYFCNLFPCVLESRWRIAALLLTIRWYRLERPPSDDLQHLPSILEADAAVNSADSAKPKMASNKIAVRFFMSELLV